MTSQVSSKFVPLLSDVMSDEALRMVYHKLHKENALRWLFFDGSCETVEDFIKLARSTKTLLYVIFNSEEEDLVGLFWLNNRTSINSSIHVAFFKKYYRRSVGISKEILSWIFTEHNGIKSLLCFIPVTNVIANSFAKRVGWVLIGTVPNLIVDAKTSQGVSGDMYYITKDEV